MAWDSKNLLGQPECKIVWYDENCRALTLPSLQEAAKYEGSNQIVLADPKPLFQKYKNVV